MSGLGSQEDGSSLAIEGGRKSRPPPLPPVRSQAAAGKRPPPPLPSGEKLHEYRQAQHRRRGANNHGGAAITEQSNTLFGQWDTDASGGLSRDEAEAGIRSRYSEVDEAYMNQLMLTFDSDGNGVLCMRRKPQSS